jgi:hypothetical protein
MRIHTSKLGRLDVRECLAAAQRSGKVTSDIEFVIGPVEYGSKSRDRAFEVQLGTWDQTSGPTKSRHFKNTGTYGADRVWAATYDEWGHFLALVFLCDRNATAGPYKGHDDFHAKTHDAYLTITDEHQRAYQAASAAGRYQGD